jgi:hypothetical protein
MGGSAIVTEDFESATDGAAPDAALWTLKLSDPSSIAVTSEQKHSGNQAVKVVGSSGETMMFNKSVFPLPDGVVYFRTWMRFESADWMNHVSFVAASPGEESQEVRFGGQQNAYHANLAADGDGVTPNPWESPACALCLAPVANEWACLRGKLDFTNNAVQLYVGDSLAVDADATEDWHSGMGKLPQGVTQLGFGWAVYGGTANTVYYDDIAIGYEPIACE